MKKIKYYPYLLSFGLVFLTTFFGEFIKRRLEPTNVLMFYLFVVVFIAIRWGRGPAVAASVAGVLSFDFFLVPPYLTLNVHDIEYLFTFGAFLAVSLVISDFASRVKDQIIQKQTEKLQSALLNSISHDLKTPLVSITGALSASLDGASRLDEQQKKKLLETARREADRLNIIVNNILDMIKTESGIQRITKKPCDLRDLIGVCLEQLNDKTVGREIKITIPGDMPELLLDFSYMMKAVINILDNAVKYSPHGSPIEIAAFFTKTAGSITISDHGQGIGKNEISRIFDKFYRGKKETEPAGMGLGLSISKNIVEAHGGRITVQSMPGQETTFIIELPRE